MADMWPIGRPMISLKETTETMDQSDAMPHPETPAIRQWENEGGSMNSHGVLPPEGISAVSVTHYRVGSYTYMSLEDALAEHKRQNKND